MKLLVATEFPPNASGGGPAVVRQMLKEWQSQDLYWWSCLPDLGERFAQSAAEVRCATIPARLYPNRKFARIKSAVLDRFWSPRAAAHLEKLLRELSPDAVWAIPHNWSIPPLARSLTSTRRNVHVTIQDYVDVHNNPQRFGVERCRRFAAMVDELYARATTRDATSHPMIADLRARTGKEAAQMLHAGLEPADFDFLERKVPRKPAGIRIAHAGTVLVEDVFALFVSALDSIRSERSKPLELHLFGAHSYAGRPWFDRRWMLEHGNLPEPELKTRLRECDWGFSPMAFTDQDPRYNRFSFPTKFISYLAAGLPVITMGHPDSSVMRIASQYNVGICCRATTAESLATELRQALHEAFPWGRHRNAIVQCARTEFDAARMRLTLYSCFSAGSEWQGNHQ